MRVFQWVLTGLLLAACQSTQGGGGGGYNSEDQPAVNPYATPDPVVGGGRVERDAGGANAGVYQRTPPAGMRSSGSRYYVTPVATPGP